MCSKRPDRFCLPFLPPFTPTGFPRGLPSSCLVYSSLERQVCRVTALKPVPAAQKRTKVQFPALLETKSEV